MDELGEVRSCWILEPGAASAMGATAMWGVQGEEPTGAQWCHQTCTLRTHGTLK